ncbi:glycosyltransferase [Sphingomonas sp. CROZ-RG-20F-R02-07]|uniref:glycosyltransferase n=1 Tax=Sphingomonas sp. CROZ-RG-20F-R02-07 TaxID=2914832 RepID=UPI001F5750D5|nr:glycosyltransferase [Sphingomonas sp. CROZ-RG-20F-R02-07]
MTLFQVSQIVYVYNQCRYVDEVVAAAYAQDYDGEMEILLSDDGSTDGSYERLLELAAGYTGRHHVRVRRTPVNKGAAYHLDQAVRECRGALIVGIAGDDIPLPHRVSSMVRHWQSLGGGTVSMYSDIELMDLEGRIIAQPSWVYTGQHDLAGIAGGFSEAIGASCAFTRDLIESFPGFGPKLIYEDRVLGWRALLLGGQIQFINDKTIRYRVEGGVSRTHAQNLKDYLGNWSVKKNTVLLEDARQRLIDADHVGSIDPDIRKICERTIATHEALIALSGSRLAGREAALLRHLPRNIDRRLVLRHYLKSRIRWLIQSRINRGFRQNGGKVG